MIESFTFGIPESEKVAQEEYLRRVRGEYSPLQEEWFTKAIQPITGQLQKQGLLTTGGAPGVILGAGMDRIMQMRQDALNALLGIGARQREASITGARLGLEKYGLEKGWELQREIEENRRRMEKDEAEKGFWASLARTGARTLPYLLKILKII